MVQKSSTFHGEFKSEEKFGARALPRAVRAFENASKSQKMGFLPYFSRFSPTFGARSARGSARAPKIFSDLKSP